MAARCITRLTALALCIAFAQFVDGLDYPGRAPGVANVRREPQRLVLENASLRAVWDLSPGKRGTGELTSLACGQTARLDNDEPFTITVADGQVLKASAFRPEGEPKAEKIEAVKDSVRGALRYGGWKIGLSLVSPDGLVRVRCDAVLRDESNYVQQVLTITSRHSLAVREVSLAAVRAEKAHVVGTVDGSPVVAGNLFFACEHPMAQHRVQGGRATASVPLFRTLEPGQACTIAQAIGVAPERQMRRAFLHYVERERARPYRPLCYYISWFDIAAPGVSMDEKQCLAVIDAFAREMVVRRGAKLDAFVFDDGWDDTSTLWQFHAGFPHGFSKVQEAAARHQAFLGTWISPFGGYGKWKAERLQYGKAQGFETNASGFALAGPKYYQSFSNVCADMMRRYGVKYLKFDGIGAGAFPSGPGKGYGADMESLIRLLDDLRKIRADAFFNTTTGTWPSPFWLWHSDSVWRGGEDVGHLGPGKKRRQWMTYRDAIGHQIRTERAPLYPFNSLKFQSVMCARLSLAAALGNEPDELIDDIRMAAASGTQLQEFFVTPAMMKPRAWDALAEAVAWVQRNADVLVDSHGIGGDPARGQPYGFVSWSPRMGIVALRNPSDRPANLSIDLQDAFELPRGAPTDYTLRPAWRKEKARLAITLRAGHPNSLPLAPFEVVVFEAAPAAGL